MKKTTILTTINEEDVFVYSEMQFNELNNIAKQSSRRFVCGSVYEGAIARPFTKMINIKDLKAISDLYPDTKIVTRGKKSKISYSKPFTELNI